LRLARQEAGIGSQEKAAERLGVSWMSVHWWEKDARGVPYEKFLALLQLYGKPIEWYFQPAGVLAPSVPSDLLALLEDHWTNFTTAEQGIVRDAVEDARRISERRRAYQIPSDKPPDGPS